MAEAAVAQCQLLHFRAGDLLLAAKRWGLQGGRPVLALHGWLDNCASFDFIAPLLPSCDVVCLDLAGHGQSEHRNHLGAYNIWQDIADLFAVADQLDWPQFSLLGHSRGAMVAMLAAGTFPSRIDHLIMIEGACPRLAEDAAAADNLAESIRHVRASMQRPRSIYKTFIDAVNARANGTFPIAQKDALALAEHGVEAVDLGFSWRYDRKLMAGSEIKLNAMQVESFCQRRTAACLLILAEQGLLLTDQAIVQWLSQRGDWSIITMAGRHHLHMSEHADEVALAINKQFASRLRMNHNNALSP